MNLDRTKKALADFDAAYAQLGSAWYENASREAQVALSENLDRLGRAVGRAYGLDTAHMNDVETCEQCVRPGPPWVVPGERDVSFVRRMVRDHS